MVYRGPEKKERDRFFKKISTLSERELMTRGRTDPQAAAAIVTKPELFEKIAESTRANFLVDLALCGHMAAMLIFETIDLSRYFPDYDQASKNLLAKIFLMYKEQLDVLLAILYHCERRYPPEVSSPLYTLIVLTQLSRKETALLSDMKQFFYAHYRLSFQARANFYCSFLEKIEARVAAENGDNTLSRWSTFLRILKTMPDVMSKTSYFLKMPAPVLARIHFELEEVGSTRSLLRAANWIHDLMADDAVWMKLIQNEYEGALFSGMSPISFYYHRKEVALLMTCIDECQGFAERDDEKSALVAELIPCLAALTAAGDPSSSLLYVKLIVEGVCTQEAAASAEKSLLTLTDCSKILLKLSDQGYQVSQSRKLLMSIGHLLRTVPNPSGLDAAMQLADIEGDASTLLSFASEDSVESTLSLHSSEESMLADDNPAELISDEELEEKGFSLGAKG